MSSDEKLPLLSDGDHSQPHYNLSPFPPSSSSPNISNQPLGDKKLLPVKLIVDRAEIKKLCDFQSSITAFSIYILREEGCFAFTKHFDLLLVTHHNPSDQVPSSAIQVRLEMIPEGKLTSIGVRISTFEPDSDDPSKLKALKDPRIGENENAFDLTGLKLHCYHRQRVPMPYTELFQRIELAIVEFFKEGNAYDLYQRNCQDFVTYVLAYLELPDKYCFVGSFSQFSTASRSSMQLILQVLAHFAFILIASLFLALTIQSIIAAEPFANSKYQCLVWDTSNCIANAECNISNYTLHGRAELQTFSGNCSFNVKVITNNHTSILPISAVPISAIVGGCHNVPAGGCCMFSVGDTAPCILNTSGNKSDVAKILKSNVFAVESIEKFWSPALYFSGALFVLFLVLAFLVLPLPSCSVSWWILGASRARYTSSTGSLQLLGFLICFALIGIVSLILADPKYTYRQFVVGYISIFSIWLVYIVLLWLVVWMFTCRNQSRAELRDRLNYLLPLPPNDISGEYKKHMNRYQNTLDLLPQPIFFSQVPSSPYPINLEPDFDE